MSNEDYIRNKALVYLRYKDNYNEIDVRDIIKFQEEVNDAYNNIPIPCKFVEGQPYANHHELTADIKAGKPMRISTDHNDSRLLPGDLNLYFRAVHDYLHYVLQAPFTAVGEIKVYHLQKKLHASEMSRRILFSEVVLQACYQEYYGKFAPFQKVILYKGKI